MTVEASVTLTIAHVALSAAHGLGVAVHATASHVAALLVQTPAQVGPVLPDTLLMRQIQSEPSMLQRFAEILRALMTLAILVLTIAVVPAAWNFRKSYKKFSDLLDRVYADVNPITHHAARISENVDYVTTAIRADVQRASATLGDANARLQEAIRQAERRAQEFEALLSVVQEEAETTFVSAAAAVRGVRTGVGQLRDDLTDPLPRSSRRRRARRRLRELADAAEEATDAAEGPDWPDDADAIRAELPPPLSMPPVTAAPNVPVEAVAPAEEAGAEVGREDYYDLEDVHDGEDDRLPHESAERPRVRPRRDRHG
jgi:uncharacterized protein YoxC